MIPIIFASVYLEANSISDKIDIPNFLAFKTEDELFGIPGLLTIYSASTKKLDSSVFSSHVTPQFLNLALISSLSNPVSET